MSDRITAKKVENSVVFDYTQHIISPPVSRKIYKLACAPVEDSDQTAHSDQNLQWALELSSVQISSGRKLRL